MINICNNCKATREYPTGKEIDKCPRCGSLYIRYKEFPKTKEESDKLLLDCIEGKEI